MAEFSGIIAPGDIDTVYSRTAIQLGTRIKDNDGNEFIFLQGVASTEQWDWVTYDELYQTTRLVVSATGPVAIAQGAILADKYGWFQVFGVGSAHVVQNTADNSTLGFETTSGRVGDGYASGDQIFFAVCRSATENSSTDEHSTVQVIYPWVGRSAVALT